jgi:hypothetical protein
MNTLIARIKAQTPIWFKSIIRLSLILATIGTALLGADGNVPNFHLTELLAKIATYMVVAGLVAAAVAKTAKEDTNV